MPRDSRAPALTLGTGNALLVVDVQNDFLPGGSLAVPDGDTVIAPLNRCLAAWRARGLPVLATRDWHPPEHCSFRAQGGCWPAHCVVGTAGAEVASGLALPSSTVVVSKGTARDYDAYSGFEGTDLDARLQEKHVRRVFVGGLATEYCVLNTVRDARARGYAVVVLEDAIRAIDVRPGDGQKAKDEMTRLGAVLIRGAVLVERGPP
jgi:nicotinamidase/pyrazinamidase